MAKTLAVLIVEDSESDTQLIVRLLRKAGYKVTSKQVETSEGMRLALEKQAWDIVISDYSLPQFDGSAALTLLQKTGLDIPFIAVSGTMGEETAVAMMKAGAHDYLMKGNLARLVPVIERELEQVGVRRERKQAQEEMKAIDKRFRALIENSADAITLLDAKGKALYDSPSAPGMLGYGPEDWIGKDVFKLMHPDDLHKNQKLFKDLLETPGECVETIFRVRHKSGTWLWIEASATNLLEEPGVNAIVLNYRDITRRMRAEEALYEQQQVFRTLVENSPDIIARYDRDCRRIYVNPAYLKTAQISQQELLSSSPTQRSPLPKASALVLQNLLRKVLDSGIAEAVDVIWPKADNIDHWYSIYASPEFDHQGRVVSVMTVSRDITERKQTEEALLGSEAGLKEAQRVGRLGNWDWDAVADIITWSEEYYHIFGFDPTQPPPGYEEHLKAYTPESAARLDSAVKKGMESGIPYELDLELAHADGPRRWITTRCEIKRDANGQIVGLRGTVRTKVSTPCVFLA